MKSLIYIASFLMLSLFSWSNTTKTTESKKSFANFTVYFKKPSNWANAKIYWWNATPSGALNNGSWPGVNMTAVCGDWYKYDFTNINSVNVIFNSGTGIQTPDLLNVTKSSYYDNGWLTTTPTICPTVGSIEVYFENTANWSQPRVYCWNPTPSSAIQCAAWPGTAMSKVSACGNWWKYTFTGVSVVNLIFNDGSSNNANKTIDLNRNTSGIYNYSWASKTWNNGAPICTVPNQKPVVNINTTNQTFSSTLSVSINATDDITPNPVIRFTTNGSTPTASSTLYTGPLSISNTTNLRAIAIDGSGLVSDVKTATFTKSAVVSNKNTDVMIQGFYWEPYKYQTEKWYTTVKNKATDLGNAGIDVIWLPPPSKNSDQRGYLPTEYYNLDSSTYGSYLQLTEANTSLKNAGLKPLADIVINHRNGNLAFADFVNPNWDCSTMMQDDEVRNASGQIQPCSGRSDDEGDNRLVNEFFKYDSARDINHNNVTVQNDIKTYLNLLKNAGFSGWRYDLAHGYPGQYSKMYNDSTSPYMAVGEVWWDFNGSDLFGISEFLEKWVKSTSNSSYVFDFSTKIAFAEVFRNGSNNYSLLKTLAGKPMGHIGINPARSVTFVENHDTWRKEINEFNYFAIRDESKHMQCYAYILTHPGLPCIYWDHFYKWGEATKTELKKLIQVRKQFGLHTTSTVNILKAENGLYAAIIDDKIAMKMGPNDWTPGTGWTLNTFGNQYAVWVKNTFLKIDDENPISLNKTTKVYPNPTKELLNIEIHEAFVNKSLEIYSINGQLVQSFPLNFTENQINISELNKGIYFGKIEDYTFKIIKE